MHLPQVGVVVDHRLVGPIALFGGGEGREVVGGWNTLECSLQRWYGWPSLLFVSERD